MTELQALTKRLFAHNAARNIKFFPGSSRDVSPEDFAREINQFFAEAENVTEEIKLEELDH